MWVAPPPDPPMVPVTIECVQHASKRARINPSILLGVLAQEGGKVGQSHSNKNGTFDHGPMQINDVWAEEILKYGITKSALRNNGCVNVYVGAWILSQKMMKHGYSWKAVGAYHSETPRLGQHYMKRVAEKIVKIASGDLSAATVLRSASAGKKPEAGRPRMAGGPIEKRKRDVLAKNAH